MTVRERLRLLRRPHRVVEEGAWVALSQASAAAASLIGVRVLTTVMTAESYGTLVVLLGLVMLGTNVVTVPLLQGTIRFLPDAVVDGRVGEFRAMVARDVFYAGGSAVAALAIGGAVWSFMAAGDLPAVAFAVAAGLLAAETVRGFETGLLSAVRRQKHFAARNATDAWARFLVAAGLVILVPTATAALLGYALASASTSLAFRGLAVRGPQERAPDVAWEVRTRASYWRFARPLFVHALLGWVLGLSDRYVIAAWMGVGAAGKYGAAYGLASQPFILSSTLVGTTLRPLLYDAVTRGDRAKERRVLLLWLAVSGTVGAIGVGLFVLLAPWVAATFLGPAFRADAVRLLPWIAGGYGIVMIQHVFEARIYAHRRTGRLVLLQCVAAAISVSVYLLLIPRRGSLGAAQAVVASFTTSTLAAFALSIPVGRSGSGLDAGPRPA